MGWVVKSWNPAAIDRLVGAAVREELADGVAWLEELETFGVLTRRLVREKRAELRDPVGVITASRGRARLRDSPVSELFRATI